MLSKIELSNFRNWPTLSLELEERSILVGPNGSGKTNILEATYLLGVTRSWRTKNDRELVGWEANVCRIVGTSRDSPVRSVEIAIQRDPYLKKIKIDGQEKKSTEAIGNIVVVLFDPRSVELVVGAPAVRRRFLDVLLAQIDHRYAKSLIEIQTVLRQRNHLLRRVSSGNSQSSEVKFWNEELVRSAEIIWQARRNFFAIAGEIFTKSYMELSGQDSAEIRYEPSVSSDQSYTDRLEEHWRHDVEQGSTSIGPHRDNFIFVLNSRQASEICSQGEGRSLVLALKKSEIKFLSENFGKNPILLLDDIFSELDSNRRSRIESIIDNHQTIITTTDLEHLDPHLRESFNIVEIEKLKE